MKKGQRWFRLRKTLRLRAILAAMVLLVLAKAWCGLVLPKLSGTVRSGAGQIAKEAGEGLFRHIWEQFYPAPDFSGQKDGGNSQEQDPSYRTAREVETFFREHEYLEIYGNEETWEMGRSGGQLARKDEKAETGTGTEEGHTGVEESLGETENSQDGSQREDAFSGGLGEENPSEFSGEGKAAPANSLPQKKYQLAQLEDYDFLMSHFYNVHTSTTADRQLMDVKKLLKKNFALYPKGQAEEGQAEEGQTEEGQAKPQILIYHTHSQEAFSDSGEGENIVEVGTYLAWLLKEKGFSVYHDRSVYDVREGKLDRNRAYTYALEGITKILEENPSIQVVIDLHRDGVKEGTRLVTEVNGKPTARIMFFNGLSQTPDGPVPYLENPNREDNLAFSLQLQLKAEAYYPGFARKIYLKGLRYNQHVRPCSCLVEVGAQTNTYEEARNAMEPLAELFQMVLRGD